MKRSFTFALAIVFSFAFIAAVSAADENTGKNVPVVPEQKLMNPRSGFSMLLGNISKIDTSDASKIKIEVNGERDNQVHIIEITPSTNITKVTDISELKVGDSVRVMARKTDDREVAVGVMFGNLKKLPAHKLSSAQGAAPDINTPPPVVKETPKK
jgi:Cu/Ag efflux protein CusF